MSNNQLSQAYEHYLLSNFALEAAEKMAEVLYSADLIEEASALRAYVANGPNSTYTIQSGPWAGCDCIVSDIDPDFKAQGPLWFDLTELTHAFPLQLKPHYANDNWLSIHPVYVWQFKAFLHLVRWEEWNAPFPADLFNPDRFETVDETAFVTNIYSDEGNTYAFWLGKFLGYETCLREARKQISVEAFTAMFPAYLGLWQGMSKLPVQAETLREALFAETLDLDFQPSRRMAFVSSNLKNFPEPNILHDVWQKLDNVSFLTAIRPQTILKTSLENIKYLQRSGLPINDYAVALTSFAPRPSVGLYL